MGNSKVKSENYITVQGFMVKDLKLKGNELIIYAIIYGFSQAERQVFSGSLQYLADWTNSTKQGVSKNLKSLVERGLIEKKDIYVNGIKFCEYNTTEFNKVYNKVVQGMQQSLIPPMQQSLTNNIVIDNIDNIKKESKKVSSYELIINELVQDNDLKDALYEFIKMRKIIKSPITDRALKMLINKLNKLSASKEEQLEILNNSIINNWKDVYSLKKDKPTISYKRQEQVPECLHKKIEEEELTEQEEQELKDIIDSFNK